MKNEMFVALRPSITTIVRPSFMKGIVRPSLAVVAIYLLYLLFLIVSRGYSALDFVHLGTVWSLRDQAGSWGYDGQFYYQLARDPLQAYHFMDNASYRYQRILYPLIVSLLTLKNSALIPYVLLFINLASIIGSVEIVSYLLCKRNLSMWYSLALGLYYGQAAALAFDTAEPFTCFLVCAGIWLLLNDRIRSAAICLGLACLAREVAILFPLAYVVQYSMQKRWRTAIVISLYGCVPILLWLSLLVLLFGHTGMTFTPPFEHVPFAGLFYYILTPRKFWLLFLLLFLPTLGSSMLCVWEIMQKRIGSGLIAWVLNLLPIIFLSHASYIDLISCGRIATCLVLAALMYGIVTRNAVILWFTQIYALTFLVFGLGVVLHMQAFLL